MQVQTFLRRLKACQSTSVSVDLYFYLFICKIILFNSWLNQGLLSPADICMQEASVFDRPAQPVSWRHPALPEGLPAVGWALPGHCTQLHVRLCPGAERRRRLSEPRRSARWHARRAAPISHQKNQQVLLPGPDQWRGPWVCGVMVAETRRPQGGLLRCSASDVEMCQASGNETRECRRGGFCSWQQWVNWQRVGCLFTYHFRQIIW